jgi:hypothetical protein
LASNYLAIIILILASSSATNFSLVLSFKIINLEGMCMQAFFGHVQQNVDAIELHNIYLAS